MAILAMTQFEEVERRLKASSLMREDAEALIITFRLMRDVILEGGSVRCDECGKARDEKHDAFCVRGLLIARLK